MTDPAGAPRRPTWREVAAMPGRRLFVAVPLANDVVAEVTQLVDRVRDGGTPGRRVRGRDVRWVRLDGLHLTLRFLGPTVEERLPAVFAAVERAASRSGPFDIVIDGGGAFPNADRPRALWLGVTDGAGQLAELAGAVSRDLSAAGWPADDRPFRPHLTLARSDGVPSAAAIAGRLSAAATGLELRSRVERIVLFESITGGGPARYVPLAAFPLAGVHG